MGIQVPNTKHDIERWDFDLNIPEPVIATIPYSLDILFEHSIATLEELSYLQLSLSYFRALRGYTFLFRGHSNSNYKLLSTLDRIDANNLDIESDILNEFVKVAKQYNYQDFLPTNTDFSQYYLGIGRHLGLICRLLDWTSSFWDAISFALHNNPSSQGCLWVMAIPRESKFENLNPLEITDKRLHILKEDFFIPDGYSFSDIPLGLLRRSRQHGYFSVVSKELCGIEIQNLSSASLAGIEIFKIDISPELKSLLIDSSKEIAPKEWYYSEWQHPIFHAIESLNSKYKK